MFYLIDLLYVIRYYVRVVHTKTPNSQTLVYQGNCIYIKQTQQYCIRCYCRDAPSEQLLIRLYLSQFPLLALS